MILLVKLGGLKPDFQAENKIKLPKLLQNRSSCSLTEKKSQAIFIGQMGHFANFLKVPFTGTLSFTGEHPTSFICKKLN